jgi:hypothetical protein
LTKYIGYQSTISSIKSTRQLSFLTYFEVHVREGIRVVASDAIDSSLELARIMKQKKKKQVESGRDGDVLSGVNARASARSLISGGQSQDGEDALLTSSGAMQFECNQIECKLVSSPLEPNTIKQQSNKLRTRPGAK